MIIVGENEAYKTITEALIAISEDSLDKTIFIKNGIYHEKLIINVPHVRLIGESKEHTIITYDDYARKIDAYGNPYGTFRTYTMLIMKPYVSLVNLTIRNDAGLGGTVGQAVALFVNANKVCVNHCKIIGNQDTLLTGPIPTDAKNQEFLNFKIDHHEKYQQYYNYCTIQGDIDFIFGSANALFRKCTIVSNNPNNDINGYISAPSTEENQLGHIFYGCELLSNARKESVYLGRPWREYAQSVFINCYMGAHINRQAFAKWDNKHLKSRFFEYGSFGPGSIREDSLSTSLDEQQVKIYLDLFL